MSSTSWSRLVVDSEGGAIELVFADSPRWSPLTYRYERDEPLVLWTYERVCLGERGRGARWSVCRRHSRDRTAGRSAVLRIPGDVSISNASGSLSVGIRAAT